LRTADNHVETTIAPRETDVLSAIGEDAGNIHLGEIISSNRGRGLKIRVQCRSASHEIA
jgi:hypothetical protein